MKLFGKLAGAALLLSQCASGSHIRKDLVEIENDTIVLVSATTVIDSSSGRVSHLPVSPAGPSDGTRGLVYYLPDPIDCQPIERSEDYMATSYIRIALISDEGECPIEAKIKQAQFDGAVGAFVYNSTMGTINASSFLSAKLNKDKPKIPIMVVDRDYGETLKLEVTSLQEEAMFIEGPRNRAIFASMYPEVDIERLSAWEIALIVLVVVLALCFCTSLSFHVSPGRRRRSQAAGRNANLAGFTKQVQTLPPCALDRLPLRIVTEDDVKTLSECTTPLDSILNAGSRARSIEEDCSIGSKADDDQICQKQEKPCCNKDTATEATFDSSNLEPKLNGCSINASNNDNVLRGCIATCIVCIDDFVVGSKMRILPCGHNYHIECIDPWLTSKSSLCPLCKYDTRSLLTDLERSYSGPRILTDESAFDDIIYGGALVDDDDNSSFLAQSRETLPIVRMSKRLLKAARQGITAPVHALARKIKSRQPQDIPYNADIDMGFVQSERQSSQGISTQTAVNAVNVVNPVNAPEVPIPAAYIARANGDDGFSNSAYAHSTNYMVEVKTNNPLPSSILSRETKADKAAAANKSAAIVVNHPRISISENMPSIDEMSKYFNTKTRHEDENI
ncbi:hypothetical protein LPJ64_000618 [Coemansia asiatica]|uniref:RING-type domain-containing protein n=1 Tax=Coemansia asiatica TaxID=1052880 RepID=A0A9W8CKR8_9FUNG|nr:hypothetical protein LPJ64_000618 [Coemansia asiatica]